MRIIVKVERVFMKDKERRLLFAVTGIILIAALVIHVWKIMNDSFWYDELYTISFIMDGRSLKDMLWIFLTDEVTNPPLYDFLLYFYYRLVPHTEFILLLPSLAAFVIGEIFCGLFIFDISGKKILPVMIALCILPFNAFSLRVITSELRSYGMLFMFSSIFLFCYFRTRRNDSMRNIILSGIVLSLLSITHYFGVIMITYFGLVDLYLIIRRRIHFRNIIMYLMPAFISGGWLLTALHFSEKSVLVFWTSAPGISDIFPLLSWMLGSKLLFFFTVIGIATIFIFALKKGELYKERIIWLLAGSIAYIVLTTFIYSAYINTAGGIFVGRYFTVCIPAAVALNAIVADRLAEKLKKVPYSGVIVLISCSLMVLGMNIVNIPIFTEDNSNYRKTSEKLAELYGDTGSDAVVLHNRQEKNYLSEGFESFYMHGIRDYTVVDEEDTDSLRGMQRVFCVMLNGVEFDSGFSEIVSDYMIEDYRGESDFIVYSKTN